MAVRLGFSYFSGGIMSVLGILQGDTHTHRALLNYLLFLSLISSLSCSWGSSKCTGAIAWLSRSLEHRELGGYSAQPHTAIFLPESLLRRRVQVFLHSTSLKLSGDFEAFLQAQGQVQRRGKLKFELEGLVPSISPFAVAPALCPTLASQHFKRKR